MNRNFYQNARKRCMPMGTNIVTDADIILMQEEEIERYRNKIKWLEKELSWYKQRVGMLEKVHNIDIGDVLTIKVGREKKRFVIDSFVIECTQTELPCIKLSGTMMKSDLFEQALEKANEIVNDEKAEAYLNRFKPFTIRIEVEDESD